jgi:hypothetical protein
MSPVCYDLAVASRRSSEIISIISAIGTPIAYLPLDFVMSGGHPEWAYVILVIQRITDHAVQTQWRLEEQAGRPVALQDTPRAGRYIYRSRGETRGIPELKDQTESQNQPTLEVLSPSVAISHSRQEAVSRRGPILSAPAPVRQVGQALNCSVMLASSQMLT